LSTDILITSEDPSGPITASLESMRSAHAARTVIKFGTDGWRDIIAENFTLENVRFAAQAHAQYLKGQSSDGSGTVVVGYDTRFASERFARASAEVMAANGLRVLLATAFTPTPALSFAVVHHAALGGVMITASHNPPAYNGYKMKGPYGGSSTPEIVRGVEAELGRLEPIPAFDPARHTIEPLEIRGAYFDALDRILDLETLRGFRGVMYHDAMGGAGCGWLEAYVKRAKLPVELRPVHGVPTPMFYGVNPEPIPQNLESLSAILRGEKSPVFAAVTDGDADRIGAVLAGGVYFNSHQIFAVLLDHLSRKGSRGRVVKTFSGSRIIDRLAAKRGLEILETPIGFKYITDAFLEGQSDPARAVLIGGEESGGMAVAGHIPERDGLLNALLMLEAVAANGKSLSELFAQIESEVGLTHAYDRLDLHLDSRVDKTALMTRLKAGAPRIAGRTVESVADLDGVKWSLDRDAWVLFRASGTEPVVRVYCEASRPEEVAAVLAEAKQLVIGVQP
jgi:phosphomannomutase